MPLLSSLAAKVFGVAVLVILIWPAVSGTAIIKALLAIGALSAGGAMVIAEIVSPR